MLETTLDEETCSPLADLNLNPPPPSDSQSPTDGPLPVVEVEAPR